MNGLEKRVKESKNRNKRLLKNCLKDGKITQSQYQETIKLIEKN